MFVCFCTVLSRARSLCLLSESRRTVKPVLSRRDPDLQVRRRLQLILLVFINLHAHANAAPCLQVRHNDEGHHTDKQHYHGFL
jgi:hypothetical protein